MAGLACVVQRYGNGVVGGSESLAREVCEHLVRRGHDVTVYTSTAADYTTWAPFFPEGETWLRGVRIRRFHSRTQREMATFNERSDRFFGEGPRGGQADWDWLQAQGPWCPGLWDEMERHREEHPVLLAFTYLYHPVVHAILNWDGPVLFYPTAHDEAPFHMPIMRQVFERADVCLFLTEDEGALVSRHYAIRAGEVIRCGVDPLPPPRPTGPPASWGQVLPYLVYAGRIEPGKGLELMWQGYEALRPKRPVELLMMGRKNMEIPDIPGIRYLGFLDSAQKSAVLHGAMALVAPSPLESLSLTTLESFLARRPVLVNKNCGPLTEHIGDGQRGLRFGDPESFARGALIFHDHPSVAERMGRAGYEYVWERYRWEVVLDHLDRWVGRFRGDL